MSITIPEILEELNLENGSNYKMAVLKKYNDNELLKRVLKMAYDTVQYNYGIRKIPEAEVSNYKHSLEDALNFLENTLATRLVTGNHAIKLLSLELGCLSPEDKEVIEKVIDRNLKINTGRTNINKVFKDLITKPIYMRCDTYSKKTAKNINFPAIVQMKADGTYRSASVSGGRVVFNSRSGEEYTYPVLEQQLRHMQDGTYTGELTVRGVTDRAEGNGLLNSDNPPHEDIIFEVWDYITPEEWKNAANKIKNKIPYKERFASLLNIISESENIKVIPYHHVSSLKEALEATSDWMSRGFEGAILKDTSAVFKDGTSKEQLKLKLEISTEVRITSFLPGNKGSKNEAYFSAVAFQNDEGTIKGQVGVTSMTEKVRDELFAKKEELIGRVMEVQFNDLSKARGSETYALSHPRFVEIREDKDETDTLEKVFALREMAMELS